MIFQISYWFLLQIDEPSKQPKRDNAGKIGYLWLPCLREAVM